MTSAPLRLVFLGTPEFAVPSLRALSRSRHPLAGVVSQPDRPRGRGRKLEPTAVHRAAQALGLPVLQPDKVGSPDALAWLRDLRPDLGVVVAFGQFVPRPVRDLPRLGMINAHGSLLPRHRGAAPIAHAIRAGDATTGISIIRLVREMDAGPECLRRETPIGPDETAGELAARLADLAAEALLEAVEKIAAGTARFEEQDASRATLAPKLDKAFGQLDWTRPREQVLRQLRAAHPWPGSTVELRPGGHRLKLLRATAGEPFGDAAPPAGRVRADRARLEIAAADGWVRILELQPAGRRPMPAEAFLRGSTLSPDEEAVPA